MKKAFLCAALALCIGAGVFAQDNSGGRQFDLWMSAGPAFGNYFMSGSGLGNNYTFSPGVNVRLYALFGERNIGLFFNHSTLMPVTSNIVGNLRPSVHHDFIPIGFGMGHYLNENLMLHFGIGPNLNMLFLYSRESGETFGDHFIGLGIGGDIGLKYRMGSFFFINVGMTLSYNFAAHREARSNVDTRRNRHTTESAGWVGGYSMIGVKPYITFGATIGRR
ncbi:MAG: hypothetical protein FWG66_05180 [Spirochaetes bacterium]|nr:hypothetical protein [Spirochaetota bacterium]